MNKTIEMIKQKGWVLSKQHIVVRAAAVMTAVVIFIYTIITETGFFRILQALINNYAGFVMAAGFFLSLISLLRFVKTFETLSDPQMEQKWKWIHLFLTGMLVITLCKILKVIFNFLFSLNFGFSAVMDLLCTTAAGFLALHGTRLLLQYSETAGRIKDYGFHHFQTDWPRIAAGICFYFAAAAAGIIGSVW